MDFIPSAQLNDLPYRPSADSSHNLPKLRCISYSIIYDTTWKVTRRQKLRGRKLTKNGN